MRSVAEAAGLSIGTIVSHQRSSAAARARAVTAYLLRNDVGLSTLDTAHVLHLRPNTVTVLFASVEGVVGTADPRAQLIERTRRLFKNGFSSSKPYPSVSPGTRAVKLLPGLLACRLAAQLTQPEVAERTGDARETLARLERLRRRAQPKTVEALA